MKVTDITKEQLENAIRTNFDSYKDAAREDNELTQIIRQTLLAIVDSGGLFTPTMAIATGIRLGLALAAQENSEPVAVEDQAVS